MLHSRHRYIIFCTPSAESHPFLLLSAPSDRIPPIIRQGPANQTLALGTRAQLQCHVMGNPLPSIQWEKDGQRILGNDERIRLMEDGTLQITNLQVPER